MLHSFPGSLSFCLSSATLILGSAPSCLLLSAGTHKTAVLETFSSFLNFALPSRSSQLKPLRPSHSPVLPFPSYFPCTPTPSPCTGSSFTTNISQSKPTLQRQPHPCISNTISIPTGTPRKKCNWPIQLKIPHIPDGFVSHGIVRLALSEQGKLGREV